MKKQFVWIAIFSIAFLSIFLFSSNGNKIDLPSGEKVILYKSESCGCCGLYMNYIKGFGLDVEVRNVEDLSGIKNELGVPAGLGSCHTMKIGDYFVEGHIPVEAIAKLMNEKPDIAGIALPDMPSGSPGMPGRKYGDFVIYQVDNNGEYKEFMRL